MALVQIKFYAPPEVRIALREHAEANDRSPGAEARRIVREYLERAGALRDEARSRAARGGESP